MWSYHTDRQMYWAEFVFQTKYLSYLQNTR